MEDGKRREGHIAVRNARVSSTGPCTFVLHTQPHQTFINNTRTNIGKGWGLDRATTARKVKNFRCAAPWAYGPPDTCPTPGPNINHTKNTGKKMGKGGRARVAD